jgi:hypothetical protein
MEPERTQARSAEEGLSRSTYVRASSLRLCSACQGSPIASKRSTACLSSASSSRTRPSAWSGRGRFDDETAGWCFTRLGPDDEAGWLHHLRLLDERLQRESLENGPYFFPDLADTTAGDELAAIDAGAIKATRIDWAGSRR